jgi:hypothetical protein
MIVYIKNASDNGHCPDSVFVMNQLFVNFQTFPVVHIFAVFFLRRVITQKEENCKKKISCCYKPLNSHYYNRLCIF